MNAGLSKADVEKFVEQSKRDGVLDVDKLGELLTHTVLPHSQFVAQTLEALAYRRIEVVKDEYGVSRDGMRMFGAMTLSLGEDADRPDRVNLVLGLRNSHDKTFSLGMVAGFRVFVCDNLSFQGDFFALARKHSKKLMDGFVDSVAIGVDRVQRHFLPMQQRVDVWRNHIAAVDLKR
jgi:hypothetical protein